MNDPSEPQPAENPVAPPPEPPADGPTPTRVRPPAPGVWGAIGWVLLLILGQAVVGVAGVVVWAVVARRQLAGPPLYALVILGTLLTSILLVGLTYGGRVWSRLAIRLPRVLHLVLVLILPVPFLIVVGEATAWLADAFRAIGLPAGWIEPRDMLAVIDALRDYDPWSLAVAVAVVGGLMPGVGEELFFRGFIGRGVVARWGVVRGVLLTSGLFGAIHLHPLQAVVAALIGVVLHAVYLWTRSLIAPMMLHAGHNCLAILGNVLTRGSEHDLAADEHVPPALAAAAACAAAGLLFLLYRSRVRWERPDGAVWSPGFPTAETPPAGVGARPVGGRLRAGEVAIVAAACALFGGVVAYTTGPGR